MNIEVGKKYKTVSGHTVEIISSTKNNCWLVGKTDHSQYKNNAWGNTWNFRPSGEFVGAESNKSFALHIVSEWIEEPTVKTERVNFNDVRIGDEIVLTSRKLKVISVDNGGTNYSLRVEAEDGNSLSIYNDLVAKHIPAPVKIKQGDFVWNGDVGRCEVLALFEDMAWLRTGSKKTVQRTIRSLKIIK